MGVRWGRTAGASRRRNVGGRWEQGEVRLREEGGEEIRKRNVGARRGRNVGPRWGRKSVGGRWRTNAVGKRGGEGMCD